MIMGVSEDKKRLIAGIPMLKPVCTGVDQSTEECVTPKGEESRIPPVLKCPPAPRKRRASRKCKYDVTALRDFINLPADWETFFTSNSIRNHVQSPI